MRLCDDGHEEVCYEGYRCPVCELTTKIERLTDEIADLKQEIDDLNFELSNAED